MNTLNKIKSVKLCLIAHPDNEIDSEFADRISDLEEIETNFSEMFEMLKMVKYELTSCIEKLSKHGYEVDFQTPFEIEQLITKITQ